MIFLDWSEVPVDGALHFPTGSPKKADVGARLAVGGDAVVGVDLDDHVLVRRLRPMRREPLAPLGCFACPALLAITAIG